jgi:beta-lactamase class A
MIDRRGFSLGLAGAALCAPARAAADPFAPLTSTCAALERENGGRLGVALFDSRSGRDFAFRGDERFPLTSTFKLLAAAAVLARVDSGAAALDRTLVFGEGDLVTYSPVTQKFAGKGMTLDAICEAAVTLSDNTAGNLQLRELGGPQGLTAFCRSLGDGVTRLDRWETALNEAAPDDERDTTSPRAMLANIRKLALGGALKPASREKLVGWMKDCKTGAERMRAKLPPGWIVGDKTGAGERGTINDVGVIWPPDGAPVVLAIYFTGSQKSASERATAIQEVGRAVAAAVR